MSVAADTRSESDAEASSPESGVLRGAARPDLLRDETLPEIFAATVATRAGHVAIVFGERRFTYAEVDAASDALARGLVRLGIGPGRVVGLWMERGADLLVAQIGIAKTGAAWLPFDADAPVERIAVCLGDADAKGLLTSESFSARAPTTHPILTAATLSDPADTTPLPARAPGLTPDAAAYMIYTSGSTGVPKGIVVTQRNICHFLRSANDLYGFAPDDVVFQGASVAFDLSMEEIWIPLLVGATLFVGTPATIGDVERLPDVLAEAGVTVLDTVPTLLAMLPREVPGLRLILMGGEALPAPLVARWARPGCRLFNTYGPTEATVVATAVEARPGEPVTIGAPIANYSAYVVDAAGRLCGPGIQGELWIGGPGVARGYLGRPELTAEKFVDNPFAAGAGDPILYRSGDAVSLTGRGELAFHGRIDDQVKVRGFRVELGEIETRISHLPGIAQAAVVLRQDDGIDRLVAFMVPERGAEVSAAKLRPELRRGMPAYMVPDHFETVAELPRLSSGKVDRKALRAAEIGFATVDAGEQEAPATETEAALLAAAKRVFGNQPIGFEADFFGELGGHSLLAARFVGAVRETPALASITLQDVYRLRSLRAMAADLVERTGGVGSQAVARDLSFESPPLLRRFLCGLAQAAMLPLILSITTAQWLGVLLTYQIIAGESFSLLAEIGILLVVYVLINIVTSAIAIAGKWLVIGRIRPGRYPLWGVYFFRWWLARRFTSLVSANWLQGSPAFRVYLRLLGAKIGRDVVISEIDIGAADLISIGDGTALGTKVSLINAELLGNELVIGTISIGRDVAMGSNVAIGRDVVIGDFSELADLTAVPAETRIGPAEQWDGSPGRRVGTVDVASLPDAAPASDRRRAGLNVVYGLALLFVPMISLLPLFPAFYLFDQLDDILADIFAIPFLYYLPLLAWPTAMLMIAFTVAVVIAMRWLIMPHRMQPGTVSIHSTAYLRKWTLGLVTEVTLETVASLYATVFMRAWYRLMGSQIGKGSEISSNLAGRYDLSEIGSHCFIADEVVYGDEEVRRGWVHSARVRTLDRVFIGNDAVLPPGAVIPSEVLIGVKSKPPANKLMSPGDTWFGSPPIKLPNRQRFVSDARQTFEPTRAARIGRVVFELFRTSLPTALFITFGVEAAYLVLYPLVLEKAWSTLLWQFPLTSVVIAILQTLLVAVVKWALMGVYKPTVHPMWSWWAQRTESVAVLYWGFSGKVLLDHLCCTPLLPWVMRLFGARLGRGVCLNMTDITEFDCVTIGDFSVVNSNAILQTHLFEDRVMKVGRLELGRGVTVGSHSTVLYDSRIGDYAVLRPLTVIMKGETIPAHSEWEGAPAVPVVHAAPDRKLAA